MRVCMVAYTFYDFDNRVRRYAETLARRGDHVDVIALRHERQSPKDIMNGVNVFRIQRRPLDKSGRLSYVLKLSLFLLKSTLFLTKKQLQNSYDLIHVHSVPDFEVFAAWLPRLMGSKIILDIHDLVPELYASKFNTGRDSPICKLLTRIERMSGAFSDHVIVANHIWRSTLVGRSIGESKCTAILNYPDRFIFTRRGRCRSDDRFIMLYPGSLNYRQGVDIAIRAFALIKDEAPEAEFHIYGIGQEKNNIIRLVAELGLKDRVFVREGVSLTEIATIMENADLGVEPKRKDSFGDEAFSTKTLEFMSVGVPTIVSDTKVHRFYFNKSLVKFFRGEDERDLASAMLMLIRDGGLRRELAKNAEEYIERNNWDVKKHEYLALVDSLVGNGKA